MNCIDYSIALAIDGRMRLMDMIASKLTDLIIVVVIVSIICIVFQLFTFFQNREILESIGEIKKNLKNGERDD